MVRILGFLVGLAFAGERQADAARMIPPRNVAVKPGAGGGDAERFGGDADIAVDPGPAGKPLVAAGGETREGEARFVGQDAEQCRGVDQAGGPERPEELERGPGAR